MRYHVPSDVPRVFHGPDPHPTSYTVRIWHQGESGQTEMIKLLNSFNIVQPLQANFE